jgi:hypothetical protein
MVISIKSIHKREDGASDEIIDNLVDKGCRVIVLGTIPFKFLIIDTNMNGPLFLGDWDNVGNPFSQSDGINKTRFQ